MLHGDRGGFTLVEALVALVIAGAVLVGTIEAFAAGMRAQRSTNEHVAALGLAELRLAEIAALTLDSLPRIAEIRDGTFPPPFEQYRWRSIVQEVPGAPALRGAAVLVEWPGGEVSLETVLFRTSRPPLSGRARAGLP